ncbi:MAG: hypothetical protein HOW73_43330 [Polyangiaceae bacterium]|nr:hypothetical protein [Polyangiaceae bacterium]
MLKAGDETALTLALRVLGVSEAAIPVAPNASETTAGYLVRFEIAHPSGRAWCTEEIYFAKAAFERWSESEVFDHIRAAVRNQIATTYRPIPAPKAKPIQNYTSPGQQRAYERARRGRSR